MRGFPAGTLQAMPPRLWDTLRACQSAGFQIMAKTSSSSWPASVRSGILTLKAAAQLELQSRTMMPRASMWHSPSYG